MFPEGRDSPTINQTKITILTDSVINGPWEQIYL